MKKIPQSPFNQSTNDPDDDASKVLTLFADTNPDQDGTEVEALQVKLGDDSSIDEDDDITVDFIA